MNTILVRAKETFFLILCCAVCVRWSWIMLSSGEVESCYLSPRCQFFYILFVIFLPFRLSTPLSLCISSHSFTIRKGNSITIRKGNITIKYQQTIFFFIIEEEYYKINVNMPLLLLCWSHGNDISGVEYLLTRISIQHTDTRYLYN